MKRWYAVYTHPKSEQLAAGHLRRQGFLVYLPRYSKRVRHARRTKYVNSPLFPRYLFVSVDVKTEPWQCIRSTIGVSNLVASGDCLAIPVPIGVVEAIKSRENQNGMVAISQSSTFEYGENVRVVQGPMSDVCGVFECEDDHGRVLVLLDIMGGRVKTRLPKTSIAASF